MEIAVNRAETKDKIETVIKPEAATIQDLGGSCPTCVSGVDPTVAGGGDFQDALRDAL